MAKKESRKSFNKELRIEGRQDLQPAIEYASLFDKIHAHYIKGDHPNGKPRVKLTDAESEVLERWELAYSILRSMRTTEETVRIIMKLKKVKKSTAYHDVTSALRLFGDISQASKEAHRNLLADYATRVLRRAYKAKDDDMVDKMLGKLIKIRGLDIEDPNIPDFDNLKQHIYNIIVDPSQIPGLENHTATEIDTMIQRYKEKRKLINEKADFIEDAKPA
ncbi:hypothetical protein [Xanthocytophaga agilis]|uniref:Uncharacterized protein n=1 Tax=Xanthocytophaga agilis TaxID=3048010 RepID=A0AAE3UFD7_9BACT|nr:hypothetical protein [Xanthocytophaga agilis]MDJ1500463.1 hypothetical protein [Xanthocytophaga agilis]